MSFTALDFGPAHRWTVFVCRDQGHPMKVGHVPGEFAEDRCPCGAPLVAVNVAPLPDEEQPRSTPTKETEPSDGR